MWASNTSRWTITGQPAGHMFRTYCIYIYILTLTNFKSHKRNAQTIGHYSISLFFFYFSIFCLAVFICVAPRFAQRALCFSNCTMTYVYIYIKFDAICIQRLPSACVHGYGLPMWLVQIRTILDIRPNLIILSPQISLSLFVQYSHERLFYMSMPMSQTRNLECDLQSVRREFVIITTVNRKSVRIPMIVEKLHQIWIRLAYNYFLR